MNYKCAFTPAQGRTHISGPGDAGMKLIGFDLLRLAAGEEYQMAAGNHETALVILSGTATVRGAGFSYEGIGGRADVFSGKPATVFLPPQTGCHIAAGSALEAAICQSRVGAGRQAPADPARGRQGSLDWQRQLAAPRIHDGGRSRTGPVPVHRRSDRAFRQLVQLSAAPARFGRPAQRG